jgi:Lrp/AsnC family leucine-responsive transcriptional regulator
MQDLGIIEAFTLKVDHAKLGTPLLALITVFMKSADHAAFKQFLAAKETIIEVHRVSGEGCYWLNIHVADQQELNALLDKILQYGNYRVSLSIDKVK